MKREFGSEKNYCVLIDSDNISHKYIKGILGEVAKFGVAQIKRLYGDMSSDNKKNWKEVALEHAITPIQQYNFTNGKNSTDSSMIINAMDILYSKDIDGFVIVSSDSDFTGLAIRLKEECKEVIGMGEKKTPRPFITACTEFKYLENLIEDETAGPVLDDIEIIEKEIINILIENEGPLLVSQLKERLKKIHPDFDQRSYGFYKLLKLLESLKGIDVTKNKTAHSVYLKDLPNESNQINLIKTETISIVKNAPKGSINMGELNTRLKEKFPTFNYKSFEFSKFAAFVNSIEELEIKKTNVNIKNKKNIKK